MSITNKIARREFLRGAAIAAASGILLLGPNAWAARALAGDSSKKRLVVIFLRGAVDGLNVVVPHGEPNYYDARPTIAIARAAARAACSTSTDFSGCIPRSRQCCRTGETARSPSCSLRLARPDALAFRRAGLHGERYAGRQDNQRRMAQSHARGDARKSQRDGSAEPRRRRCRASSRARWRSRTCRWGARRRVRCRSIGRSSRPHSIGCTTAATRSATPIAKGATRVRI